MTAIIQ